MGTDLLAGEKRKRGAVMYCSGILWNTTCVLVKYSHVTSGILVKYSGILLVN